MEKQEKERTIAVPILVWLGQVIAGWALSQWFTRLWNKYKKKKTDDNK